MWSCSAAGCPSPAQAVARAAGEAQKLAGTEAVEDPQDVKELPKKQPLQCPMARLLIRIPA